MKTEIKNFDEKEKLAWLRLARTENIGAITFHQFVKYYGSAQKALDALPGLAARGGKKRAPVIPPAAAIEKEIETLRKLGASLLCSGEEAYPDALAQTEDAPPIITVRGNAALLHKPCIAIVGARNASLGGRKFAGALARDLGAAGQVIVSGLARGIDTAAHEGALETGTIAVLAGGIDVIYPPENQKLYDSIAERGLIVAENPPGMPPRARDFPRRNRIVSGLSSGVIVVEATERSGSLITARLAGEQGRDVYAVPGHPFDPRAEGPNRLLRDGAVLTRGAQDVLENLLAPKRFSLQDSAANDFALPPGAHEADAQDEDEARRVILNNLSWTPVSIDDLIRETCIPAALAQGILLELELAGNVARLPGNRAVLMTDEAANS